MIQINVINIKELLKDTFYQLRVVTSIGLFDNYDMFHNIYEQYEEPCRRILIITRDSRLEEVYEERQAFPFSSLGNIWIKEFPINTPIESIDLNSIYINQEEYVQIKAMIEK